MPDQERQLGKLGAILNALRGRGVSHYPRFPDRSGNLTQLPDDKIIEEATMALDDLQIGDSPDLSGYLNRCRETLDEVKGLTEYQDQKSTRLLTIVTFLSAFSGVLFSRFADTYPIRLFWIQFGLSANTILVVLAYLFFGLFAFGAVCGALVIFHATQTQFRYPITKSKDPGKVDLLPNSYLFYSAIVGLRPHDWARSFVTASVDKKSSMDSKLSVRYLKNYVVESYLVAAKVADKLRYLQPGQELLSFSIRMLLLSFVFLCITAVMVPTKYEMDANKVSGAQRVPSSEQSHKASEQPVSSKEFAPTAGRIPDLKQEKKAKVK